MYCQWYYKREHVFSYIKKQCELLKCIERGGIWFVVTEIFTVNRLENITPKLDISFFALQQPLKSVILQTTLGIDSKSSFHFILGCKEPIVRVVVLAILVFIDWLIELFPVYETMLWH